MEVGANPSLLQEKGGVHPGQVTNTQEILQEKWDYPTSSWRSNPDWMGLKFCHLFSYLFSLVKSSRTVLIYDRNPDLTMSSFCDAHFSCISGRFNHKTERLLMVFEKHEKHFACIRTSECPTFLRVFTGIISAWKKLVALCQQSEKRGSRISLAALALMRPAHASACFIQLIYLQPALSSH